MVREYRVPRIGGAPLLAAAARTSSQSTESHMTRRLTLISCVAALAFAVPIAGLQLAFAPTAVAEAADPREGDPGYERSQRLFGLLRETLDEAARRRLEQQTDPDTLAEDFLWRQFGLDDRSRVRELLGLGLRDDDRRAGGRRCSEEHCSAPGPKSRR